VRKGKLLILLTGMPCSGKSVIADICKSLGFIVINMGDVIREEAKRRGLSLTRENLSKLALELRAREGANVVALRTLSKLSEILSKGYTKIVVDGVRSWEEVITFKENLKDWRIIVLAVHASPRTRFRRAKERRRSDDPRDFREFLKRDLEELKLGIGNVIALADVIIINEDKEIGELKDIVRNLLVRINDGSRGKS